MNSNKKYVKLLSSGLFFLVVHFSFNHISSIAKDSQKVLNEAQILLMPNEEHKTVFGEKPPMIGWHEACTLKDYQRHHRI